MAQTKKARRAGSHKQRNKARRPRRHQNPAVRHHRRRSVRNPGGKIMQYAVAGASVVGGAVGSKALTQLVLQSKNTGAMGYAGNLGATVALGWGAHMFFRDKSISTMVVAGGIAQLIIRILSDQTPYGTMLAGSGLGDYMTNWNFATPQRVAPGYPPSAIAPPAGWGTSAPSAVPVVTHSTAGKAGSASAGMGYYDWN